MRPRFYQTILAVACAAVVSPVLAQVDLEVKVMQVESFDFAPGIVTQTVAKKFQGTPAEVESRLKGAILATFSQELSSTKLLSLAVRDDSLRRLAKEWKVSEEFGSGKTEDAITGPSVADVTHIAYAKVEDLVAILMPPNIKKVGNMVLSASEWKIGAVISLEVTTRKTGTKKVIKEDFEVSGSGTNFGVDSRNQTRLENNVQEFDAAIVRKFVDGISKKLGMRVIDSCCPIRITSARGKLFNIDRGRAAGLKEGQIMELTERADDEFGTDSGFPIGKARVKTVKEDSTLMELVSDEGVDELKGDRTKLTVTRPVEAKFAEPEPKPAAPSKTSSSKKSK
jgi:hypothetical protein